MVKHSFFIGMWVPTCIQQEIQIAQNRVQSIQDAKIRFVDPTIAHITLQFLGSIDDAQVLDDINALHQVKQKPFLLTTGTNLDLFLKRDRAVMYIPLLDSPELTDFVTKLQESLNTFISLDQRSFHTHLTIARVNDIKNKHEFIEQVRMIQLPQMQFLINSFELIESIRTEQGSNYVTRVSFLLH